MKENDMDTIAELILNVVENIENESVLADVRKKVNSMMDGLPLFSF